MSKYDYEIWDGENNVEANAEGNYFSIEVDPVEMKKDDLKHAIVKLSTVIEALRLEGFYVKWPNDFNEEDE